MFGLPPLPPHFHAAVRDVEATRPAARLAAAERLGRAEGADERAAARAGLAKLAQDALPEVRAAALAALGGLEAREELPLVLAALDDPFPEVREFAALAAAQIGGPHALAALRAALKHAGAEVRFQAVAALTELDPEGAAQALVPMLKDSDAEVRAQVVEALGALERPELLGHLAGALGDELPQVRLQAALALAAQNDARGSKQLLAALVARERVPEVAEALGRIGCQAAREPLSRLALAWFVAPELRAAAAAALTRLGDPRGVRGLRRVLHGLRSDARSYAVELAGALHVGEFAQDLARLARRPRGTDLLTLIAALASYAPHSSEARAALETLARSDGEVGQAARAAVNRHEPGG